MAEHKDIYEIGSDSDTEVDELKQEEVPKKVKKVKRKFTRAKQTEYIITTTHTFNGMKELLEHLGIKKHTLFNIIKRKGGVYKDSIITSKHID